MLWSIAAALVLLWIIGLSTATTFGGLLHLLLMAAIVVVVFRVLQGRGPSTKRLA